MCATLTLHSSNGCIDIQDAIQLNLISAPTKSTSPPSLFSRRKKLYKYDYTAGKDSLLPYASPAVISELRRHIRIIRAQLRSYLF